MKTLLSLFDYSGHWSEPFALAGWNVIQWDIKLDELLAIETIEDVETALDLFEDVHGIIAAPPCTHFSSSGAQYWPAKDADGRTAQAIEMVNQVQRIADLFLPTDFEYYEDPENTFFWAIENPVGRLNKLVQELGTPYYFNPSDFAGWLDLTAADHNELDRLRRKDGRNISRDEVEFIIKCNAYTKKTGLWGDYNRDLEKRPIEPVKVCGQGSPLMLLGGKSEKTKEARSNTPLGFAYAFFNAQLEHQAEIY